MAHFAEIDPSTGIVKRVVAVNNAVIRDSAGVEREDKGIEFCMQLYGRQTQWVQTSYNAKFRKYFAGKGYVYNAENDVFVKPCPPGEGWTLDLDSLEWVR